MSDWVQEFEIDADYAAFAKERLEIICTEPDPSASAAEIEEYDRRRFDFFIELLNSLQTAELSPEGWDESARKALTVLRIYRTYEDINKGQTVGRLGQQLDFTLTTRLLWLELTERSSLLLLHRNKFMLRKLVEEDVPHFLAADAIMDPTIFQMFAEIYGSELLGQSEREKVLAAAEKCLDAIASFTDFRAPILDTIATVMEAGSEVGEACAAVTAMALSNPFGVEQETLLEKVLKNLEPGNVLPYLRRIVTAIDNHPDLPDEQKGRQKHALFILLAKAYATNDVFLRALEQSDLGLGSEFKVHVEAKRVALGLDAYYLESQLFDGRAAGPVSSRLSKENRVCALYMPTSSDQSPAVGMRPLDAREQRRPDGDLLMVWSAQTGDVEAVCRAGNEKWTLDVVIADLDAYETLRFFARSGGRVDQAEYSEYLLEKFYDLESIELDEESVGVLLWVVEVNWGDNDIRDRAFVLLDECLDSIDSGEDALTWIRNLVSIAADKGDICRRAALGYIVHSSLTFGAEHGLTRLAVLAVAATEGDYSVLSVFNELARGARDETITYVLHQIRIAVFMELEKGRIQSVIAQPAPNKVDEKIQALLEEKDLVLFEDEIYGVSRVAVEYDIPRAMDNGSVKVRAIIYYPPSDRDDARSSIIFEYYPLEDWRGPHPDRYSEVRRDYIQRGGLILCENQGLLKQLEVESLHSDVLKSHRSQAWADIMKRLGTPPSAHKRGKARAVKEASVLLSSLDVPYESCEPLKIEEVLDESVALVQQWRLDLEGADGFDLKGVCEQIAHAYSDGQGKEIKKAVRPLVRSGERGNALVLQLLLSTLVADKRVDVELFGASLSMAAGLYCQLMPMGEDERELDRDAIRIYCLLVQLPRDRFIQRWMGSDRSEGKQLELYLAGKRIFVTGTHPARLAFRYVCFAETLREIHSHLHTSGVVSLDTLRDNTRILQAEMQAYIRIVKNYQSGRGRESSEDVVSAIETCAVLAYTANGQAVIGQRISGVLGTIVSAIEETRASAREALSQTMPGLAATRGSEGESARVIVLTLKASQVSEVADLQRSYPEPFEAHLTETEREERRKKALLERLKGWLTRIMESMLSEESVAAGAAITDGNFLRMQELIQRERFESLSPIIWQQMQETMRELIDRKNGRELGQYAQEFVGAIESVVVRPHVEIGDSIREAVWEIVLLTGLEQPELAGVFAQEFAKVWAPLLGKSILEDSFLPVHLLGASVAAEFPPYQEVLKEDLFNADPFKKFIEEKHGKAACRIAVPIAQAQTCERYAGYLQTYSAKQAEINERFERDIALYEQHVQALQAWAQDGAKVPRDYVAIVENAVAFAGDEQALVPRILGEQVGDEPEGFVQKYRGLQQGFSDALSTWRDSVETWTSEYLDLFKPVEKFSKDVSLVSAFNREGLLTELGIGNSRREREQVPYGFIRLAACRMANAGQGWRNLLAEKANTARNELQPIADLRYQKTSPQVAAYMEQIGERSLNFSTLDLEDPILLSVGDRKISKSELLRKPEGILGQVHDLLIQDEEWIGVPSSEGTSGHKGLREQFDIAAANRVMMQEVSRQSQDLVRLIDSTELEGKFKVVQSLEKMQTLDIRTFSQLHDWLRAGGAPYARDDAAIFCSDFEALWEMKLDKKDALILGGVPVNFDIGDNGRVVWQDCSEHLNMLVRAVKIRSGGSQYQSSDELDLGEAGVRQELGCGLEAEYVLNHVLSLLSGAAQAEIATLPGYFETLEDLYIEAIESEIREAQLEQAAPADEGPGGAALERLARDPLENIEFYTELIRTKAQEILALRDRLQADADRKNSGIAVSLMPVDRLQTEIFADGVSLPQGGDFWEVKPAALEESDLPLVDFTIGIQNWTDLAEGRLAIGEVTDLQKAQLLVAYFRHVKTQRSLHEKIMIRWYTTLDEFGGVHEYREALPLSLEEFQDWSRQTREIAWPEKSGVGEPLTVVFVSSESVLGKMHNISIDFSQRGQIPADIIPCYFEFVQSSKKGKGAKGSTLNYGFSADGRFVILMPSEDGVKAIDFFRLDQEQQEKVYNHFNSAYGFGSLAEMIYFFTCAYQAWLYKKMAGAVAEQFPMEKERVVDIAIAAQGGFMLGDGELLSADQVFEILRQADVSPEQLRSLMDGEAGVPEEGRGRTGIEIYLDILRGKLLEDDFPDAVALEIVHSIKAVIKLKTHRDVMPLRVDMNLLEEEKVQRRSPYSKGEVLLDVPRPPDSLSRSHARIVGFRQRSAFVSNVTRGFTPGEWVVATTRDRGAPRDYVPGFVSTGKPPGFISLDPTETGIAHVWIHLGNNTWTILEVMPVRPTRQAVENAAFTEIHLPQRETHVDGVIIADLKSGFAELRLKDREGQKGILRKKGVEIFLLKTGNPHAETVDLVVHDTQHNNYVVCTVPRSDLVNLEIKQIPSDLGFYEFSLPVMRNQTCQIKWETLAESLAGRYGDPYAEFLTLEESIAVLGQMTDLTKEQTAEISGAYELLPSTICRMLNIQNFGMQVAMAYIFSEGQNIPPEIAREMLADERVLSAVQLAAQDYTRASAVQISNVRDFVREMGLTASLLEYVNSWADRRTLAIAFYDACMRYKSIEDLRINRIPGPIAQRMLRTRKDGSVEERELGEAVFHAIKPDAGQAGEELPGFRTALEIVREEGFTSALLTTMERQGTIGVVVRALRQTLDTTVYSDRLVEGEGEEAEEIRRQRCGQIDAYIRSYGIPPWVAADVVMQLRKDIAMRQAALEGEAVRSRAQLQGEQELDLAILDWFGVKVTPDESLDGTVVLDAGNFDADTIWMVGELGEEYYTRLMSLCSRFWLRARGTLPHGHQVELPDYVTEFDAYRTRLAARAADAYADWYRENFGKMSTT